MLTALQAFQVIFDLDTEGARQVASLRPLLTEPSPDSDHLTTLSFLIRMS